MEKIEFKRGGIRDGEAVFDLWIGGELIRRGLTIDQAVQEISDRSPGPIRTPEERMRMETRAEA